MSENYKTEAFQNLIYAAPEHVFEYFAPDLFKSRAKGQKIEFIEPHFSYVDTSSGNKLETCDACLSLPLKNGKTAVMFIVIENELNQNLPLRMFQLFCHIRSRITNAEILPICIFTGRVTKNKPISHYILEYCGMKLDFGFTLCAVDTLDEAKLMADERPFALALLTAKLALEADGDPVKRGKFGVYIAELLSKK